MRTIFTYGPKDTVPGIAAARLHAAEPVRFERGKQADDIER